MRRKSSIEPQTPPPALHPALQSVLANLDVQLEEELTRYRRLRARKPVAPRKHRNLTGAMGTKGDAAHSAVVDRAAPLPPTAFAAPRGGEPPLPPTSPLAIAPPGSVPPMSSDASVSSLAARLSSSKTLQPQDQPAPLAADLPPAAEETLESSEQLLRSLAEEETELRQRDQDPGVLSSLLTPLGIGSMLLLLLSSVTFGYLLMNPATLGLISFSNSDAPPETGATAGTTGSTATASPHTSGVPSGPNLAEQEFVDLNLDTLSGVPGEPRPVAPAPVTPPGPVAAQPPISPAQPDSPVSSTSPAVTTPAVPQVAPAVPQNQPAARPTVRVAPATTTRPSNSPAARSAAAPAVPERQAVRPTEGRPALPTAPSPARNSAPSAPASPTAQPPARPAAPSSPAAPQATVPRPASSPEFRVVVPYRGDRSLEEARRVVGDAYVRNFPDGARIQLGAFSNSERAAQLQQELQQQGIEAEIYRPSGQ